MPPAPASMTANQLQKLLDSGDLSQRGAARDLGISERQMRRYCAGDAPVPKVIELALRYVCEHKDKP